MGALLDVRRAHRRRSAGASIAVVLTVGLLGGTALAAWAGARRPASTFAAYEPDARFPISCSLRAALGSFCKLYADQEAAHGIRMNNVLPGFIDTRPVNESIRAGIPAGRYGKSGEIAKTVAFLLSPDAGYITGQNVRVDGGLTRSV